MAGFGLLRRRAPIPAAATPIGFDAVEVRLVTKQVEQAVELRQSAERVTDILSEPTGVSYRAMTSSDDAERTGEWQQLAVDDVLFVIPPNQPTDPRHRVHRLARRIRFSLAHYEVTGNVHVPPGVDATAFVSRYGARFVALTNATNRHLDAGEAEERSPVLIVNLRAATSVRPAE